MWLRTRVKWGAGSVSRERFCETVDRRAMPGRLTFLPDRPGARMPLRRRLESLPGVREEDGRVLGSLERRAVAGGVVLQRRVFRSLAAVDAALPRALGHA